MKHDEAHKFRGMEVANPLPERRYCQPDALDSASVLQDLPGLSLNPHQIQENSHSPLDI